MSKNYLKRIIQNVRNTLYLRCPQRLAPVRAASASLSWALQESHFQAQWPRAFTVYQLELLAVYLKNHLRSETQIWIYFSTPKLLLSQYSMK